MTDTERLASHRAEHEVAEYAGGRYEGIEADVYDYARREREKAPNDSIEEVYERAAAYLITDIRTYDEAVKESEEQKEYQGYKIRV